MNLREKYPTVSCLLDEGSIKINGLPPEEEDPSVSWAIRRIDPDAVRRNKSWILSPESATRLPELGLVADSSSLSFLAELEHGRKKLERANAWVAKLTMEQKREWLRRNNVRMRREPFDHQVNAIGWCLINPWGALFLDTGLGKTFIISTVLQAIRDTGVTKPFLVVAPKTLLRGSWDEEIEESTWLKVYNMCEPPALPGIVKCEFCEAEFNRKSSRTHLLKHINASELDCFYEKNPQYLPEGKITREQRAAMALASNAADVYLINPDLLRSIHQSIIGKFYVTVVDESSMMRSHESKTTNAVLEVGRSSPRRIIASGTPRPNTDMELWAQFAMLDGSLGQSFYSFRNKYFSKSADGYSYYMKPGADMEFRSIVNSRCLAYKLDECVDLPGETTEKRMVELSSETMSYYEEMRKEMLIEINSQEVTAEYLVVQMNKLSQIASGFVYDKDKNAHYIGEKNAKVEETVRCAENLVVDQGRQVVIWIRYSKFEAAELASRISGLGVSIVIGGQESDFTFEQIKLFKSGKNKVMIAHPLSAKFGHTWVNANAAIFHSYDFSWENYYQAKRRIYRIGQKNPVTYINIIARRTIDEKVMSAILKKERNSDMAFDKKLMMEILRNG